MTPCHQPPLNTMQLRGYLCLSLISTVATAIGLPGPVFQLQNSVQFHAIAPFDDVKVPVQLGVMSRCPDALLCEAVWNDVLKKVADKVHLSLVYIAKYCLPNLDSTVAYQRKGSTPQSQILV